jgi:hypothetical protein
MPTSIAPGSVISDGMHPKTLGYIELIDVRDEPLMRLLTDLQHGTQEMKLEGFPHWTPKQFVTFFCREMGSKAIG